MSILVHYRFVYKDKFMEFLSRTLIIVIFPSSHIRNSKLTILYLPTRYREPQYRVDRRAVSSVLSSTATAVSTIEIALTTNRLESIPSRESDFIIPGYWYRPARARARETHKTQRALINQQLLVLAGSRARARARRDSFSVQKGHRARIIAAADAQTGAARHNFDFHTGVERT